MKKSILIIQSVVIAVLLGVVIYLCINDNETTKSYAVIYNNESNLSVEVYENGKVEKPTDPIKEEYIFDGWYLDDQLFDFSKNIDKNIILVAKYKEDESLKATITFDSDGGSNVEKIIIKKGNKIELPDSPTKDGYIFKEWQVNGKAFDASQIINESITLKAIWEVYVAPKTFTVTFDSNGGSKIANRTIEDGKTVSKPTNPIKSGYTFKEWQLNGKTYNFSNKITSNITLKAVWTEKVITYSPEWIKITESVIGEYKLYIKNSNGSRVSGTCSVKYTNGTTVTETIGQSGVVKIKDAISSVTNCKKG